MERVVLQAAIAPSGEDEERIRRSLEHVRWTMPGMLTALSGAVLSARLAAREAARDDLAGHVHRDAIGSGHGASDGARAYAAAAGLVAAWGASALTNVNAWQRRSERSTRPLAGDLAATSAVLLPRLRRTAATEAAHAFNEERSLIVRASFSLPEGRGEFPYEEIPYEDEESAGELLLPDAGPYRSAPARLPPPEPEERLVKVWSALVDGKVCPECAWMHGTTIEGDEEFPDGDPPRHPFCRCTYILLWTGLSAAEIERGYDEEREAA